MLAGVGGAIICQPVATPQPYACLDGSFPSQTRENCTADRICTSSCQCFDGKTTLTNDEVEEFTIAGIEGQCTLQSVGLNCYITRPHDHRFHNYACVCAACYNHAAMISSTSK